MRHIRSIMMLILLGCAAFPTAARASTVADTIQGIVALGLLAAGALLVLFLIVLVVCIYMLPAIIAVFRGHQFKWVITVLTLFSAWSGVGYIIAFVWAVWPKKTSLLDPLLGDPTANDGHQSIAARFGKMARVFKDQIR